MQEDELSLKKAIESGDTDLSKFTMNNINIKKNFIIIIYKTLTLKFIYIYIILYS